MSSMNGTEQVTGNELDVVQATFTNPVIMDELMKICSGSTGLLPLRLISKDFNTAVLNHVCRTGTPLLDLKHVVTVSRRRDGKGRLISTTDMLEAVVNEFEPRICRNIRLDFSSFWRSKFVDRRAYEDNLITAFLKICQSNGPEGWIHSIELMRVDERHVNSLLVEGIQHCCPGLRRLQLTLVGNSTDDRANEVPFTIGPFSKLKSLELSGFPRRSTPVTRGIIHAANNLQRLSIDGLMFLELMDVPEFRCLRELEVKNDVDIVQFLTTLAKTNFPHLVKITLPVIQSDSSFFESLESLTHLQKLCFPAVKNFEFHIGGHCSEIGESGAIMQLHSLFPCLSKIRIMDYDLGSLRRPGGNVDSRILATFSKISLWRGTLRDLDIKFHTRHYFSLRHLEQVLTAMGPTIFMNGLRKLKFQGSCITGFGFIDRAYDRLFRILLSMKNIREVVFKDIALPAMYAQKDDKLASFLKEHGLTNITANRWFP